MRHVGVTPSISRLALSGAAVEQHGIPVRGDVPVPLGIGIAGVPCLSVNPPSPRSERELSPSRGVSGIGHRLPALRTSESRHDAIPSSVGAIFPLPNSGTQTFAVGEKLGPGPVQRNSGLPGFLGNPSEGVSHPTLNSRQLGPGGRCRCHRVETHLNFPQRVTQFALRIRNGCIRGKGTAKSCEYAVECRSMRTRISCPCFQARKHAITVVRKSDHAHARGGRLCSCRIGNRDTNGNILARLASRNQQYRDTKPQGRSRGCRGKD
jgi:hypothetical protein